ncbi:MAG: cytochrome c family protein [Deltaproteobacteria bacterium]
MKKTFGVFALGLGLVVCPLYSGFAMSADEIDLKQAFNVEGKQKAVIFPHARHQAALECTDCHKTPDGGKGTLKFAIEKKDGMANDFHKKACWPCHEEKKVPKGKTCTTCHK